LRRSLFLLALATSSASATDHSPSDIEFVLAHSPFDSYYVCGEHHQGELAYLGDDLGTDCMVSKLVTVDDRTWARTYEGDGLRNEQWFSWRATLLAPCECEVVKIHLNPVQNEPGKLGQPPASSMVFKRSDGVHILYAHIQEPAVAVGDKVAYGQPVAKVGNNGYGRNPHVHVGAWRDGKAIQLRWDLANMESAVNSSE
jgi:hypothetical protein